VIASTSQVILVALGSGVVSGIAVTLVQEFFESRARAASLEATRAERAAEVREQRRRESARIVGPALVVLRDLEPERFVMLTLRPNRVQADAILSQRWDRWLAASGELQVLGATHPDTDVDRLCQSVIDKGTELLRVIEHFYEEPELNYSFFTETKATHADATSDARSLVRAVLDQPA
jgi:hypothetical protein